MYKVFMKRLAKVEDAILIISMAIILLLTFANVVGRFVFNHSLAFADELVVAIFVLVSLLGAALCAREDEGLIGLAIFSSRLTGGTRPKQKLIANFFSIVYCAVLTDMGFLRVLTSYAQGEHTFVMHAARWIFWAFIPICGICLILHFIENTKDFLAEQGSKNQNEVNA